ncbi:hypothetical protein UFOVP1124_24 [uncultured Caudovirales phage]|uniref:Uncharacterized protein n=1 Tax=uncultured Caudovirales phage TaxID=2100421 RepID=A0A6J5QPW7_9CAUD|nr:hypothetical protein UFOVP1124_24 [uncultured Caudovirales phage]
MIFFAERTGNDEMEIPGGVAGVVVRGSRGG